ncbi:MAG: type II secretion system F family protein [Deltaproteobacteria bacterium]|nr:MAG: type II secretion system F family protein [Deltaproteobacteria bacterium]
MPVFEYTALDKKGKNISGIIDADSAIAARQRLRATNNFPVSIKEIEDIPAKKESKGISLPSLFVRVRQRDVTMMTRQLATLVGAGFPLVSAIDALLPQMKSYTFNKVLARIKDSIVEGSSFANALGLYSDTFSPLYINMIRAGESSGTLEIVLAQLADIMEKQQELKSRIRSALAYPILMTVIGTIVLTLLLVFIVPSITAIFADMNQVLPAPTLFLIAFSKLLKSYWWIIVIVIAALVVAFRNFKKTTKGRFLVDKTKLSLPMSGTLTKKLAVARFSRTLGSLLENGVSMLPSLEIAKNIAGNLLISNAVEAAAKEVGQGQGLAVALSNANTFPNLSIQMIQVGEQSAELESMLNKMADVFEKEAESSIMSMTSLLGPILILIMGIVVGFIVLSICMPIFEMSQLIR